MAVVVAGMSLLQLAQLIAAVAGGADALVKLHADLSAAGIRPQDMLKPEHLEAVRKALEPIRPAASGVYVDPEAWRGT